MTTTSIDRAGAYSRPNARFDEDGQFEIRASASGNCRRALWYSATGYELTNLPSEESLTAMEAGNALEPVVLRAMERAGWKVTPTEPQDPQTVTVRIGPNPVSGTGQALLVTGHPDATGRMPSVSSTELAPHLMRGQALPEEEAAAKAAATIQMFLFGDEALAPAHGDPMVVEVKTRGPEAFKRWRTLGSRAQPPGIGGPGSLLHAGNSSATFGTPSIATMDTGSRTWDYEVIPAAKRLERALEDGLRVAWRVLARSPRPQRAGPRRAAGAGTSCCRQLAVQILPLPGRSACRVMAEASDEATEIRRRGGERRGRSGRGGGLCGCPGYR